MSAFKSREALMVDTAVRTCPPDHKHAAAGTCYNQHGCRCFPCRTARAKIQRDRRRQKAYGRYQPNRISSLGAQRRLQALIRQGWSQKKLAARLGVPPQRVYQLLREATMSPRTHQAIADVFDELWDKEPTRATTPQLIAYNRTVRYGAARGWARPLDWDDIDNDAAPAHVARPNDEVDDMAVELAVLGESVRLTPAERRAAVRILHGYGLTDPDIANRLACSDRTVLRIRHGELHLPAHTETSAA